MKDVQYVGPKAQFATITGSPLWGKSVEEVINEWHSRGWTLKSQSRPVTPYGAGPDTYLFVTPSGRNIIWIPSYGGVAGRDWKYDQSEMKLFWILWQAGVEVLLIGGTSGIAEWRNTADRIEPGDLVLPTDFRTNPDHRGLLGTEYEMAWPKSDLVLDDPFCTELASTLEKTAQGYVGEGLLRKVHTPKEARVALVVPDGITFETTFDIEMWMAITSRISEMRPDLPPRVTLHGDCINPVLARLLGIHVAYYHLVANWAQGLQPDIGIVNTLYPLYLENFPRIALDMEPRLLETFVIPDGTNCQCKQSLHTAPEVFNLSMTQE